MITESNPNANNPEPIMGEIVIAYPISDRVCQDLLTTAAESICQYWASFRVVEVDANNDYVKIHIVEDWAHSDEKPRVCQVITPKTMFEGLQNLATAAASKRFPTATQHLMDAITENWDAVTADVVLQMALFNDIIYG